MSVFGKKSTTDTGREAERKVAQFLNKKKHHKIVDKNWRTRWCEIDVISTHKKCVYFTEVKYRSSTDWGDGFAYITDKKLNQMRFAAEFWLTQHNWEGEACLQAASVDIDDTIELIEL